VFKTNEKMKAETVFNVAIHLSDYELQRLNNLIVDKLKLKPEKVLKKLFKTEEEEKRMLRLIKTCFSKIKE
jgi:hypothetical protein